VLTVFGRVLGTPPRRVTLKCVADGRPQSWWVDVPRARDDRDGVIPAMWARRMIQSLEEVNDVRWMPHTKRDARAQAKARQTLLEVSKQFNIVCSLTSFIAVEHRSIEERNDGRPALRRVPVQLAKGWGGVSQGPGRDLRSLMTGPHGMMMSCMRTSPPAAGAGRAVPDEWLAEVQRAASTPARGPVEPDLLHALLVTQSAQGWFNVCESSLAAVVPEWKVWQDQVAVELAKIAPRLKLEPLTVWTVLVVVVLHRRFGWQNNRWYAGSRKALRYVAAEWNADVNDLQRWVNEFKPSPGGR
jgi:hypothetical protein